MQIDTKSPLASVIQNLALQSEPSPTTSATTSAVAGKVYNFPSRPESCFPGGIPGSGQSPEQQFGEMFGRVMDMFKSFIGALKDMGLKIVPDTATTELPGTTEGVDPSTVTPGTGATSGTEGTVAPEQAQPTLFDKIGEFFDGIKTKFGNLQDKLGQVLGDAIKDPGKALKKVSSIFSKIGKLFTGKNLLKNIGSFFTGGGLTGIIGKGIKAITKFF